jgi:hypothetical protein
MMFLKFATGWVMRACAGRSPIRSPGGGFAGIPLDGTVVHPSTLMKLTTRCGRGCCCRR